MADVYLLDSVKVATSTTGTGSVTVGAAEPGYLTPAEAGAVDGLVYTWRLDDGDDFEIFVGTYSSSGPSVSRDTVLVSKISGTVGTSKLDLSGSATLSAVPVADYVVTPRQIREVLTADRTYYVRTDGSDSNDGLTNSPGGAFRTLQKAVDTVMALDPSIYTPTIQVGDGTYTVGATLGPVIGRARPVIKGNSATPSNVVISVTGANCFTVTGRWYIKDMKLQTTTSGNGIDVAAGGDVYWSNIDFGPCAIFGVRARYGSRAVADGNYTISGGGYYHIHVGYGASVETFGRTVTLTGTPAFSGGYVQVMGGGCYIAGSMTFSGSATGARYTATLNGVIETNGGGANYFPGNAAGSTTTGGQYA